MTYWPNHSFEHPIQKQCDLSLQANRYISYPLIYLILSNANHFAIYIEDTLEYIRENLTSEMDLGFLANRASFSKIYFHKLFKASTGRTIHQYIEEQRIKKAINLMISTDMTLSQVAYECGFSSQSYFCYAFKRNTGLTPRAYTKEVAKQYSEGLA